MLFRSNSIKNSHIGNKHQDLPPKCNLASITISASATHRRPAATTTFLATNHVEMPITRVPESTTQLWTMASLRSLAATHSGPATRVSEVATQAIDDSKYIFLSCNRL